MDGEIEVAKRREESTRMRETAVRASFIQSDLIKPLTFAYLQYLHQLIFCGHFAKTKMYFK